MPLRPIFYDTETTGIRPDRDRIIEIAAFDPVRGKTLERLINPGISIPAEATAIHHITNEMVESAPGFHVIAQEFIEFCEGDVVLIAHNNDAFDLHFLRHEFQRADAAMPQWKFLDSLKWARRYRRDLPRHTLQFLREMYGIPSNNAHRALDDVVVLHQVFSNLIDDLTMEQVMDLLNKQREITHMPFGKHQGMLLQDLPSSYVAWLAGSGALDKPDNAELRATLDKLGKLPKQ